MAGEGEKAAKTNDVVSMNQPSLFWKVMAYLWANMVKPLARGFVYGSGSILGACIIRFYVM